MPAPFPSLPWLDQRPSGIPAVKICGFRDGGNLAAIAALGVDAVGLNFWPGSKRHVDPATARAWLPDLPDATSRIGVFVDPAEEEVARLFDDGIIHAAQLHGSEPPALVAALMARGIPVIRAFGLRAESDFVTAAATGTPYLLADAFAPGEYGGTGRTVDWDLVAAAWQSAAPSARLILSGGLTPENVAQAVAHVRPAMVDCASGVESAPGIKDPARVAAFLAAVRSTLKIPSAP